MTATLYRHNAEERFIFDWLCPGVVAQARLVLLSMVTEIRPCRLFLFSVSYVNAPSLYTLREIRHLAGQERSGAVPLLYLIESDLLFDFF